VKDSGPAGCVRNVHVTARTLALAWPAGSCRDRSRRLSAFLAGGWTILPVPRSNGRAGRGRAPGAGNAAAGVSGKAKTARPWLTAPGVGRAGEAPFRRTPQPRDRFTR
jgi:hypothetical protein